MHLLLLLGNQTEDFCRYWQTIKYHIFNFDQKNNFNSFREIRERKEHKDFVAKIDASLNLFRILFYFEYLQK